MSNTQSQSDDQLKETLAPRSTCDPPQIPNPQNKISHRLGYANPGESKLSVSV